MSGGAPGPHHVGVVDRFIDTVQASGRLSFSLDEIASATPIAGRALEAALRRRVKAGRIVRVAAKTGFFVIVPPEHRTMGCAPVECWLDDFMSFLGTPYYVGLLSAAASHGSAHFALMETQVVTSVWIRPIQVGRVRLRFFQRRNVATMPVETRQGEWAPLNVATPETVAIDLFRFGICGVDRAALALAEMPERLDGERLIAALDCAEDTPAAQRLGYVLDWLGRSPQADMVKHWLEDRPTRRVALQPDTRSRMPPAFDERWRVLGEMPQGMLA